MSYPQRKGKETISAARHFAPKHVQISNIKIAEGEFRVCFSGTFEGDYIRDAACKWFKPQYLHLGNEFFAMGFSIIDKTIGLATAWNAQCARGNEILVNKGRILHDSNSGITFMVEPLINRFSKYNSNSGWIGNRNYWQVRAMEAFSHFTYHQSGGELIVCDLQGRYTADPRNNEKSRFLLSDPAICSRGGNYGPTDLGEKGIDSFFANHVCNVFCERHWDKPHNIRQWFARTRGTCMIPKIVSHQLLLSDPHPFYHDTEYIGAAIREADEESTFYHDTEYIGAAIKETMEQSSNSDYSVGQSFEQWDESLLVDTDDDLPEEDSAEAAEPYDGYYVSEEQHDYYFHSAASGSFYG